MTPEFSKAVDPVFLRVLDLLSRIQKREHGEPADEHARVKKAIERAESELGSEEDEWALAKYALVTWADDVLYGAEWPGRNWWANNFLEVEIFRTRDASTEFFRKAKQAGSLRTRNALEVYYVCVMLGFRGVYADPNLVVQAQGANPELAPSLGRWVRQTAEGIQLGRGRPPIVDNPQEGAGASALRGKFQLIAALFVTMTLLGTSILMAYFADRKGVRFFDRQEPPTTSADEKSSS